MQISYGNQKHNPTGRQSRPAGPVEAGNGREKGFEMMTAAKREKRIRHIAAKRAQLAAEDRRLELEAGPLEREPSRPLGYSFPPLRGKALLDVMDRQGSVAA